MTESNNDISWAIKASPCHTHTMIDHRCCVLYTTIGQSPTLNIILRDKSYTNTKDYRNYKKINDFVCRKKPSRNEPPDKENPKKKKKKHAWTEKGKEKVYKAAATRSNIVVQHLSI